MTRDCNAPKYVLFEQQPNNRNFERTLYSMFANHRVCIVWRSSAHHIDGWNWPKLMHKPKYTSLVLRSFTTRPQAITIGSRVETIGGPMWSDPMAGIQSSVESKIPTLLLNRATMHNRSRKARPALSCRIIKLKFEK